MVYEFKDELLDLVDDNDQVIGAIWRSEAIRTKSKNFRAVAGFLVNKKGQLWIPRRVAQKVSFPSAFDMSFAGHVSSGETYEKAFAREVAEELRLDVSILSWRILGKMTPSADGLACFSLIYEISYEQTPNYNRDDYCEAFWLYPHEVLEKLAAGQRSKEGLPLMIKRFYMSKIC